MHLGDWKSRDEEKRKLRIEVSGLRRALEIQQEARAGLKKENQKLKKEKKKYEEKIKELENKCRKLEEQRDRYRNMIFKPNKKDAAQTEGGNSCNKKEDVKKRKGGGQKGHLGKGRKLPDRIDEVRRIYLEKCPDCGNSLDRSETIDEHTIEDIPPPENQRSKVTRWEIELQWCKKCHRRVKSVVEEIIPKSRLGINILSYVLIHKYAARNTWEIILWNLAHWYGIKVSKGALINMMRQARKRLGKRYEQILEEIRAAPVKHADETGWRVNGTNHWAWGFFTKQSAYYSIEESRGKGVAEEILRGSHENDVLVRDDYGGYRKLPLKHQSCWSHLLRNCREAADQPDASHEVCRLHKRLKEMYASLSETIERPFNLNERQAEYERFLKELQNIITTKYSCDDTIKIQVRLTNQNSNLLTALLYDNVPLTNNLAERGIRPLVVTRKISGGSRSWEGAKTHAVNMSVLQTIRLQNQPIVPTLKNYLLSSHN